MKNNFDYWVNINTRNFLIFYWVQCAFFYFLAVGFAIKSRNPFSFLIVEIIFSVVILIFGSIRSPFGSLENGIKKNDMLLFDRFMEKIPEEYTRSSKRISGYILLALMKEPEVNLNSKILSFKRNYSGVYKHAAFSLILWFITYFALGAYLYGSR